MNKRPVVFFISVWIAVLLAGLAFGPGCSCSGASEAVSNGSTLNGSASSGHGGASSTAGTGGNLFGNPTVGSANGGGMTSSSLAITPTDPVIDVTIVDGVVTSILSAGKNANPLQFSATFQGSPVKASWSLNRGELGTLDPAKGAFVASGSAFGTAIVTATYGGSHQTTNLTVNVHWTQNGIPANEPAATGDGVGGVPLGGPVADPVKTALLMTNEPTPVPAADLAWLYPYDKTVWPRGIEAPLLQWDTTHPASSVYVHLKETGFEFDGFYGGTNLQNQPIEAAAWTAATNSNGGDPLHIDLKIASGGTVYGPVSEDWTIATGFLTGTVYYNSYDSQIPMKPANAPAGAFGAVLAIQPGAQSPVVAISSTSSACHVCHTVSSDGSTIVMQGPSFKDQDPPTLDRTTVFSLATQQQTAYFADGTANQNKFDWAGLYPDGSMAVATSGDGFHHYAGNSDLFKVLDGSTIASTGFGSAITQAVTPSFSPDGRHLAFSFLAGPGSATVMPSALHTLALLDFDCGAPAGSVACNGQKYDFSGLRLLDQETTRYVGWPSFLPDSSGVVFQSTVVATTGGGSNLYTWLGGEAEIWSVPTPAAGAAAPTPLPLYALNGFDAQGNSYLPSAAHGIDATTNRPLDTVLNYEPTVNPIASGGYFWVVFTSRRAYGNVLTGDPWADENAGTPDLFTKKLWVAAVDINGKVATDPSHPAFYLPGQELHAGNMRGFWVVDPCRADGKTCESGGQCCNGYCQAAPGTTGLICSSTTTKGCSGELEKCTSAADCCNPSDECINGHCAMVPPK